MRLTGLLMLLGAAGAMACGDSTGGGGGGGRSQTITVGDNFFSPNPDTAAAGTLTFSFSSGPHNVTWDTGPTTPTNSGNLSSGTYTATVVAGTYDFHCSLHAGMNGRVVVE